MRCSTFHPKLIYILWSDALFQCLVKLFTIPLTCCKSGGFRHNTSSSAALIWRKSAGSTTFPTVNTTVEFSISGALLGWMQKRKFIYIHLSNSFYSFRPAEIWGHSINFTISIQVNILCSLLDLLRSVWYLGNLFSDAADSRFYLVGVRIWPHHLGASWWTLKFVDLSDVYTWPGLSYPLVIQGHVWSQEALLTCQRFQCVFRLFWHLRPQYMNLFISYHIMIIFYIHLKVGRRSYLLNLSVNTRSRWEKHLTKIL